MTSGPVDGTHRERPLGVAVIGIFLLANAAVAVAEAAFDERGFTRLASLTSSGEWGLPTILALSAAGTVAAIGLWLGSRRAWVLTMLLVGFSLILDLALYWAGEPRYLRMALDVVLAFYLNQGAVRVWVEPPADPAGEPLRQG